MINQDSELKLQAYLDGELPAREAAEVADWLAKDQDGQALLAELKNTKMALAGNEAELKLPETREFYWSKIQREIERQDKMATPVRAISWMAWLRHHLVSVGGAAMLTCVMAVMLLHGAGAGQFAEMEVASDDMGAYTFRNQQDKMTMVWFYNRNDDTEVAEPATIASMDPE